MPAAAAPAIDTLTLSSADLSVDVAAAFPQVVAYHHASGGELGGNPEALTSVVLNGKPYAVQATGSQINSTTAEWNLAFPDLPGVSLASRITVEGNVVTFAVTGVTDTDAFRVGTIDIPGHDLVTVNSSQPGATVVSSKVSPDRNTSGDTIQPVTADLAAGNATGSAYGIVHTNTLAAAIDTNSVYDQSNGPAQSEGGRVWRQVQDQDGAKAVSLWSGQWTYRAAQAPFTEELPWAKIVVTPEANGDGAVDWQDGAVALRGILRAPQGSEETPERVIPHIPFNFASQATHPFLRTLDDVKRTSLATDGLGQLAVLKGYGSEGHDSAHPDYGGNYNTRAGGLEDMNTLLREGAKWGADFGVHVNATEAYPEAKTFSETLVNENAPGWDWIDQSYYIDQRTDLASGAIQKRFQQLRDETDPALKFLYIDVYYQFGWLQERLAQELRGQGWQIGTEWSYHFEEDALWSHWANDESYGGSTNKGLNSDVIRFLRNHQKDTWNPNKLLGNTEIVEFEGWTGETDWNAFLKNVWQRNLPTKFLQTQQILDWDANKVRLTGDVRVENDGADLGSRKIFVGDAQVLAGNKYLLPWKTSNGTEKLYHYNADGGQTAWQLTKPWQQVKQVQVYKLTDQGRQHVGTVPVRGGKVTLNAEAGVAYVLERSTQAVASPDAAWGAGTNIADPGFNAGNLTKWNPTGGARIGVVNGGHAVAELPVGGESSIHQDVAGLTPGRNALGVWVEIEKGKTRKTTVSVTSGGTTRDVEIDTTTAENFVAADEKHGSFFQRLEVPFDVASKKDSVRISVKAGDGGGAVRVDDVRIVAKDRPVEGQLPQGVLVQEDFENVVQGWSPFVKGNAGGSTDPRTHLAELHAPFTQAGWNGKKIDDVLAGNWSLKSHAENGGLVYRTVPQTADFQAGHKYRVTFDHQATAGGYDWVTGYDSVRGGEPRSVTLKSTPITAQTTIKRFVDEFVAGSCGEYWVGLSTGGNGGDFVLDNVLIEDLGADATPVACGTLAIDAPDKLLPGQANDLTTTFTSDEATATGPLTLDLNAPEGWTVTAKDAFTFPAVNPGDTVTTTWTVVPASDADKGPHALDATAKYTIDGAERSATAATSVGALAAPPVGDNWASDLDWVSAENGWGPVERDRANGESGSGDGPALKLEGVTYAKGLGVHAVSNIRYYLGGRCETFTAEVGVDDYQPTRGSITFAVRADGVQVAQTAKMTPTTPTVSLVANVDGAQYVDLVVGDAGDGVGNDHGDWANARFSCSGDGTGIPGTGTGGIIPKSQLRIADVSSADPAGGQASFAIDGNIVTQWHSRWSDVDPDAGYPHHITIDTGSARQLKALQYLPRQDGGSNGPIKGYEIYVSADGTTWGPAVATGEFPNNRETQRVEFAPVDGRYIKLVATSSQNGAVFASAAEIDVEQVIP
ncbi:endo-alpha-N-acetylgalactosaminidase family protein [Pseudarthrobacter sp. J64]|uniref:endo-alpha-N-acetylgalactosaminidase family protein n=1 Tax=Pseudarthrobacter sp. J64 TaxID=3116485 RepID=UPI002E80B4D7|nr:endo-alpha-N-acetylgalactosaminidase family protein [Pseudarthrobacter sp. J64]MEE2569572.1 endo-alpha-N-acetylgalactosaminidase family protein [Pseudarthrobacter sp. J64]